MQATTAPGPVTSVCEKIVAAAHWVLHAQSVKLYLIDPVRREFYCKVTIAAH